MKRNSSSGGGGGRDSGRDDAQRLSSSIPSFSIGELVRMIDRELGGSRSLKLSVNLQLALDHWADMNSGMPCPDTDALDMFGFIDELLGIVEEHRENMREEET